MCGIAGILSSPSGERPERAELAAMISRLHHRGPDGTGILLDGAVGLAHARLSIIDVTGGDQPIFNEDRTVAVVFNGEIFNYVELRRELAARGHRFTTDSDTEVLVHLYEEHGERLVEHLNGQFAIALWDSTRQQLVLARDRTGMRPLFYAHHSGRLLFASEAKALFAIPGVTRAIDRRALAQISTFWSALAPRSAFEGVFCLPAGHVMVARGGTEKIRRYWDWVFPGHVPAPPESEEACADELRQLLTDAVRMQLRADVPVGAYLSGGLDSAIIASLVRELGVSQLRTFSLTFEDPEFDESTHQRALVDFLGTRHTSIRCTAADIAAAFPRTVRHTESPIVRTAPTPLLLLSGHVRSAGYKVVLTGEGADEVFGGYDLFKEARIRRFWSRFPESAWRHRLLERLYPYLANSPVAGGAFSQGFFRQGMEQVQKPWFAHIPRWQTTGRSTRYFSPALRAEMHDWNPYEEIAATLPDDISRWIPMGRDQYVEAHTLMTGYLLSSQGDRVAMANSVEGRYPFLDHRVIEFGNRLPPGLKLRGLTEKYLLKRSMRDRLPPAVLKRTKQPYRAPDSQSFFPQGRAVPYVDELLDAGSIEAAGLYDAGRVSLLVEKCRAGKAVGFADNMAFVSILSTMLVHEQLVIGNEIEGGHAAAHVPQRIATQ